MDPFCREQKKDSDASGIHKTTKNTPAFGTRVPERTFCVLRCERAKLGTEEANNRHTTEMHTRTGKHDMTHCADLNSQDPNRQDLRCQAPSGHDLMRQWLSGDARSGSVPSGDALNGVEHRRCT